jgi:zinc/manganese transport system substrate-binding protein
VRRVLLLLLLAALALPAGAAAKHDPFTVVAAENFWGSIAAQLAGNRATVQSIIVNPDTDPHSYEPTPSDARTMAVSKIAIVNGIGYDGWASKLLDASPWSGRIVVDTGQVLGLQDGDNPHQWYSPESVHTVIDAIVAALDKADPSARRYFAARELAFESKGLARYNSLRAEIRRSYAGVPVGYSESIFEPLGTSLGLELATPAGFAKAVAEGTDVSAGDLQTVERQLRRRQVKVWVFNSQNVTPDVQRLNGIAKAAHVPVVTVTETLSPATLDFEQWQVAQLGRLRVALHQATGR